MEKAKKETIEQSGVRKGSPMEGFFGVCGGKDRRECRYQTSIIAHRRTSNALMRNFMNIAVFNEAKKLAMLRV